MQVHLVCGLALRFFLYDSRYAIWSLTTHHTYFVRPIEGAKIIWMNNVNEIDKNLNFDGKRGKKVVALELIMPVF